MDKAEKTILIVFIIIVTSCVLLAVFCALVFKVTEELIPEVPTPAMPTVGVCTAPVVDSKIAINNEPEKILAALETQSVLETTEIPFADLNSIAVRLSGRKNIETSLTTPPVQYQIGDQSNFYKLDENNNSVLTTATLRYATDTVYFWAENDIEVDKRDLKTMVDIFSNEIYPTNHDFFGTEWIPGVDNDPHLFILYARGLGDTLAGYASSADYVLPAANPYSNAREMFVINADVEEITDPYILSTMAHELQHVIMGYRDPNEDLWLNEGFSELATLINGYDAGGFDYWFVNQPDMQLNDWSPDPDLNDLNYGASYLFTTYMMSRFGDTFTRAIVADPLNGFTSIDNTLRVNNMIDPLTGNLITGDEFFRDWTLTNYLNSPDWSDGRYHYDNYDSVPTVSEVTWLNDCEGTTEFETVHQYGTDYFQIACDNPVELKFSGNETIAILPDGGENTSTIMWSNRGDVSDTTMTREFDFTNYSGQITFNFDLWYDLEQDFDYGYLEIQLEDGDWQILESDSCVTYNPNGNSYGCGYNGSSAGWLPISVDLSRFAGHKIRLRFETISDGALSVEGLAVDNLSIPEIGYAENFESGTDGWETQGFARIHNLVPQSFLVSLLTSDPENKVQKYQVNAGEELTLTIDPNCLDNDPILVVSGTSRFTRQLADYTITLAE